MQAERVVDGLVVLGTPPHRVSRGKAGSSERAAVNLDGQDVVVIQTQATRLNPYVFGQALLSMDLIRQRWSPQSLRSVLICVKDDPELRPIAAQFPGLEVRIEHPVHREQSFRIPASPAPPLPWQRARAGSRWHPPGSVLT